MVSAPETVWPAVSDCVRINGMTPPILSVATFETRPAIVILMLSVLSAELYMWMKSIRLPVNLKTHRSLETFQVKACSRPS